MKSYAFLVLFVIYSLPSFLAQNDGNILLNFLNFIQEGQSNLNLEQSDNKEPLLSEYDFIVVGAGTAGCVLAARLSENPNWNVLLLEAGGPELLVMDIPMAAHFLQLSSKVNWGYRTEPSNKYCLGFNNNRCNFPRGRVMGGSSTLNYMIYTRGNRRDYDAWARMGNKGWSYRDILPYFKKLENFSVPDADADYVGRSGPVRISYSNWRSYLSESFVNAFQEDGLSYRDYDGARQVGVSYIHSTTDQQYRWSSNRAYLYPLKGQRPNLYISKNSLVTKILIDSTTKTAYGVRYEKLDQTFEVRARMEVISSAGAINTPQLLMLSGIGPAKHLREVDIKPLADLAVGFNLQDHFAPALTFFVNITSIKLDQFFSLDALLNLPRANSMLSIPGGVETLAFYELDNTTNPDGWPDLEIFTTSGSFDANPIVVTGFGFKNNDYNAIYTDIVNNNLNAYMMWPMILKPRSRGRIKLRSKDPRQHPRIYPNYLRDPYDVDMIVRGLQKAIDLANRPSLRKVKATLLNRPLPRCRKYGDVTSRAYLECYARHFTLTMYHQSGTAKMGPRSDRSSVVDPRLRVHGIKNLRVVDASIMPSLVAGHTNGPVFMIAEKAADMIKEDYGFT